MKQRILTLLAGMALGMALLGGGYAATAALTARPTTQTFYLKGEKINLTAYLIGGSNYVRLRDIGRAADFGVEYNASTNSVNIDPDAHYEQETASSAQTAGDPSAKTDAEKPHVTYSKSNYPDLTDTGSDTYRTLDYDQSVYFFNFRTSWQAGARYLEEKYAANMRAGYPGFYGIFANADKDVVTYETYSDQDNVKVNAVQFRTYDNLEARTLDASGRFSVKNLPNGPYKLCVWFDYTQSDGTVKTASAWTPVYVSNGNAYFADGIKHGQHLYGYTQFSVISIEEWLAKNGMRFLADRQFQDWMAEHGSDDLEAALRLDNVTYPFYSGTKQYPNDTPKWQALAHEICPDEDINDFHKAYLLHEWMSHNLVYDRRMICNADGSERDKTLLYRWAENGGGEWTTWNTHIGVCYDFANIYAIMCRELDIPCRVLHDKRLNHTMNTVYLNGRWEIVDITHSVKSYYIDNTKAALQAFWDDWEGPGPSAERSEGFIIPVAEYYKVYANEYDVTIADRMVGINALDNFLSTKNLLQNWGIPEFNH